LDTDFLKNLEKIQIFFSKNFIPDFYRIFFEIKILEKNKSLFFIFKTKYKKFGKYFP